MFLELTDKTQDATVPHLGWILGKKPGGADFERSITSSQTSEARRVRGKYVPCPEGVRYVVEVHNDEMAWMLRLRKENKPSYVSAAPYAVSVLNLKGVGVCLRSALDGKRADGDSQGPELMTTPRPLEARIGPFLGSEERIRATFQDFGLRVAFEPCEQGPAITPSELVHAVRLNAVLPVTEFLQRIFLGAFYLTVDQHGEKYLPDTQVQSLIEISKGWLGGCPNASRVIARLARGSQELTDAWGAAANEASPEAEPLGFQADLAEKKLEGKRLHTMRHDLLLRNLPDRPGLRVVDLGCGDGKLTMRILAERTDARVHAIDADEMNLVWLRRKAHRMAGGLWRARLTPQRDNIVWPAVEDFELVTDVVILSEVIEHLTAHDRRRLLQQCAQLWKAPCILLTTPNRAYNIAWGMADGETRHKDHQIEYDYATFLEEVVVPLQAMGYEVRFESLLTELDAEGAYPIFSDPGRGGAADASRPEGWRNLVQPSWIIVATRTPEAPPAPCNPRYAGRTLHEPLHLHETGYTVRANEMLTGLTHPVFLAHRERLAFLAPTIAPVDYNPKYPEYLEHPATALEYFFKRGVTELVAEVKHMGSRMTLVAFSSHKAASAFGYLLDPSRAPIYCWSRQGFPFFDRQDPLPDTLWQGLKAGGYFEGYNYAHDVIVLDGEFMPWSYKAGKGSKSLIDQEFRAPGWAALRDHLQKDAPRGVAAAQDYLHTLERFAAPTAPHYVPFDVLLAGKVSDRQRPLQEVTRMGHLRRDRVCWLNDCARKLKETAPILRPLTHMWISLGLPEINARAARLLEGFWRKVTEDQHLEGIVVKPNADETLPDGTPIQHGLKVRGKDYLRLIYGMHYLEPEFFQRLTRRNTAPKRALALQETALAARIVASFMRRQPAEKDRYVAAFLGADGHLSADIDKTL